ncbi:MAG: sensor histidine kinase [Candidatus Thiodiazotropha sp.]|jgi:two-component system, NarL family, sensor histidine kinase UhpB
MISDINSAVEEERKFIARELHDHLNAELLFIKLKLRRFKTTCAKQDFDRDELRNAIDELLERVSNVYDSSRNIVTLLRPEVMDSLGLVGAIEERIDLFVRSQPDCRISFTHEGDFSELNYSVSIAIFRIVQEALTNAGKHAQAAKIEIHLYLKSKNCPSGINLRVTDDGKGFDIQNHSRGRLGLISMRERTSELKGQLTVKSAIGEGTQIIACIPL